MKTIALTGGIGAGKSTVTDYLTSIGYTVIDADRMSREMTSAGGKAMPYIMQHFGPDYINDDGSLNRAAMRDLVFRNPRYMKVLEEGTTNVVISDIEALRKQKEEEGAEALFFDIPLLFEKHQEDNYDQVWVVTADHDIRAARVMKRDNIEPSLIDLIIGSQEDDEYKVSRADIVLNNNGTVDELLRSVDEALKNITDAAI